MSKVIIHEPMDCNCPKCMTEFDKAHAEMFGEAI